MFIHLPKLWFQNAFFSFNTSHNSCLCHCSKVHRGQTFSPLKWTKTCPWDTINHFNCLISVGPSSERCSPFKETAIQGQQAVNCNQAWLQSDTRLVLVPFSTTTSFLFLSLSHPPTPPDVTLYSLPIHSYVFNRMSEITLKDLKPLQWDCVALPSSLAPSFSSPATPTLQKKTQTLLTLNYSRCSNPRESRLIRRTLHEINVIDSLSVYCRQPPPPVENAGEISSLVPSAFAVFKIALYVM